MDVKTMFSGHFTLHWILLVPALLILVMAAFRAKVKYTCWPVRQRRRCAVWYSRK